MCAHDNRPIRNEHFRMCIEKQITYDRSKRNVFLENMSMKCEKSYENGTSTILVTSSQTAVII